MQRCVAIARHLAVTACHDNNSLHYRDIPDLSGPDAEWLASLNAAHLNLHWRSNSYSIVIYKYSSFLYFRTIYHACIHCYPEQQHNCSYLLSSIEIPHISNLG
jgi:hypothetical protein